MSTLYGSINGRPAGHLERERGGKITWRYQPQYPHQATPLSTLAPIATGGLTGPSIQAWIEGLLPDTHGVCERWARELGVRNRPFDLLGTKIGLELPGAVTFSPDPDGPDPDLGDADPVSEAEIAQLLRGMHQDTTRWVQPHATGRFSLAGVQAKTALLRDQNGGWLRPHGAWATSHILKPPIPGLPDHHINEFMCMRAAWYMGLPVARVELACFEDQPAVIVERFDRDLRGERYVRLHQEDMCQATGTPPNQKYQSEGGPSVLTMIDTLRRNVAPDAAQDDIDTLVSAQVFNWVIAGTDAHAKNYGLLLDGPIVRLAPLYDLGSALSDPQVDERELKLAMSIAGSYDVSNPYRGPWHERAAKEWRVDHDRLVSQLTLQLDHVPKIFWLIAAELADDGWASPTIEVLANRIQHRAEREGPLVL